MGEEEIVNRIKRLENEVSELSVTTKEIKTLLDRFVNDERMSPALSRNVMGVSRVSNANPWTIDTTKRIMQVRKGRRDFIDSAREETYKKTLRVLKSQNKWLSAEDIGEKTKRARQTESTYLCRLYRAGLLEQKTDGNKILYRITDSNKINQIFGDF